MNHYFTSKKMKTTRYCDSIFCWIFALLYTYKIFFSKETFYGLRMEMTDINLLLFTTILNLRLHLGTRYFQSIKTILDVVLLVFSLRRRALPNTVNFLKVHFKNQSCVRFNYHRTIVCQLYTLFLIRQSCNV